MAFRLSVSALLLVCLGPLRASDEDARQRLRAAAQAQSEGRLPSAWTQWQLAHEVAFSNYLNIEALARMSGVSAKGSREAATTSALLLAYFHATPPRWLSEATRNHLGELIAERIASGVAPDLPPDQSVRGVVFQGVPTGLGFEGTRYFWMNHLPSIPPPAGSQVINGVPIQLGDDDRLPDARLPAGDGWAVVEPRHSGREMPESVKQAWRFDRCLVGYSFEPIVRFTNELGREITVPIEPWYPDQQAVWQLRFRLFYPSTVMCGKDYRAVAENLMDALLRAHWLGVEALGREAWNSTWQDEVVDIWLTPNAAEDSLHAGGERWLNNLYFYHADTPREPFEWVREALHEYAHVMMPRIGRYGDARQYELWLDGPIGELLLLELLRPTLAAAASESLPPWMQALRSRPPHAERPEWRVPLEVWGQAGPVAPEQALLDDRGAAWLMGFALWLSEAHTPRLVYDYWRGLSPNAQYVGDSLIRAYQARIKEERLFTLAATRPVRVLSDTAPTRELGGLALTDLTQVEYLAWLPEGNYQLRLISRAPGAATVSIGGGTLRLVETGSDARSAPATAIRSSGGWYRIAVAGFSTTPTVLSHLQLERQGR